MKTVTQIKPDGSLLSEVDMCDLCAEKYTTEFAQVTEADLYVDECRICGKTRWEESPPVEEEEKELEAFLWGEIN